MAGALHTAALTGCFISLPAAATVILLALLSLRCSGAGRLALILSIFILSCSLIFVTSVFVCHKILLDQ